MPELPMAHIPWSYSLPGLRVWEVEGVPSPPWWQEVLAAPLSLLFCQAGGVEITLEHGQVIDAKQQDILLLSQAAPVQGLQGAGPVRQQQIQMTLEREELLEPLLGFLLPRYTEEGKYTLNIAVGCTGGRHRSVAVARAVADALTRGGADVALSCRDLEKGG